ncbi:hypothetical protein PDE_08141 [Penicillium oxalicum 114-2]|uniref:RanBD1 domain-containing protein n=1 Tax=Penicillium oxalicum (strain 114-2 / CGMCC 5302) TaxID=933388 RepID=S7ZRW1_PENO1|nr:hypothetical protein PDE_08141 [Penicillium oxalicum 114-2]
MSKRTAQGPQGSKETELDFGMQGTPDDKPQRATAAQLASRKIKEIRKRPRGTTPTGGAGEAPAAFGQLPSAPAFQPPSSFSAPPSQPSGFSFGQSQSQSFPGATAAPAQPSQDSPFSFGASNSTPFNFSGGFGAAPSNPFAGSAFGAGNAAPAQPSTSATSVSFGGFGNQSTTQPAFSFGATQTASSTASGSGNGGLFGQTSGTNASSNAAGDSMQMSPEAKPKSIFAASSDPQGKDIFGGSGSFGKPAVSANNSDFNLDGAHVAYNVNKQPAVEGNPFAPKSTASSQPNASSQSKPFGSLFGATPVSSNPPESKATADSNVFAQKPAAPSNPFSFQSASSDTAKAPSTQAQSGGLFSTKPASTQSAPSGLFAQAAPSPNLFAPKAPSSDTASAAPSTQTTNNIFGTSTTTQPSIFGDKSSSKSLFAPQSNQVEAPEKPAQLNPFGSLFGASSNAPETPPSSKPAETKPFAGLFGGLPATTKPAEASSTLKLFGAPVPAAAPPVEAKPSESGSQSTSLFGAAAPTFNAPPTTGATQSLFAAKPTTEQPSTSPAKPFANLPSSETGAASSKPASTTDLDNSKQKEIPATYQRLKIPPGTSKEVAEGAELLWKIRALDTQFQKQVLKYQPGIDCFDDLILFYMRIRNAMGAPVKASTETKQKSAHVDVVNGSATSSVFAKSFSAPNSGKEAPASSVSAQGTAKSLFANASANGSVTSPAPAAPAASPVKPASNMFAQAASPAPSASASPAKPTGNMFAQAASPAPNSSASSKLSGNMFAQPVSQASQNGTATPTPPKFGASVGTVDFMAQFKQKAEKTMKEEKAKRKAEDFDSEEDDEEEWERRDAEKQREKRAKLEAEGVKKKKSVFRNGKFEWVDVDEPTSADSSGTTSLSTDGPADKAVEKPSEKPAASNLFAPSDSASITAPSAGSSTGSIFESSGRPLPASENIFGSLTPSQNDSGKDSDESDVEEKVESKQAKPAEPAGAAKSSINAPLPAPTAEAGRSLFDRVSSPTPTPQKDAASSTSSLFSASFGQNNSFGKSTSFGQNSTTSSGDKNSSFGPSMSFGQNSTTPAAGKTNNPFGQSISFGQSTTAPAADKTWKPSSPIKFSTESAAAATSAPASTLPSTQASSEANSGAATPEDEISSGEVFDMSKANAGEEEESVVFECKARAFKLATGWQLQGTGVLRLLQHPGTNRARIVLRTDPGGNVILNTFLKKDLDYSRQGNSVQFMVPQADKAQPEHWTVRVNAQSIEKLHPKMQEIKN